MLPQKGIKYVCKISYNQYEQGKIYACHQDGYLNVNGFNYRISDEVFFENYFNILEEIKYFQQIGRGKRSNASEVLHVGDFGLTVEEVGQFHKNIANALSDKEENITIEPLTTFSKNLTKDKIVLHVMNDLNDRSRVGVEKYGVTLERDDLSLKDWLQHAYEECLDQANYLKRAILEIENKQG